MSDSRNRSRGGGGSGSRRDSRDRRSNEHIRPTPPSRRERDFPPPRGPMEGRGGPPSLGSINAAGGGTKLSGVAFTDTELMNEIPKKKFSGRCRLFVGNLPNEVKEAELKELFTPHGDISECYLSGKGFAFLRLDTRAHAESAKEALDGKTLHGRQVRVRFAVHGATIKVKELAPVVSNEMLYLTFSIFGDVERAIHIVDEKGKPTGEGIVEFERKSSAQDAINQIRDRVFLMTANSRPLKAEMLEPRDEEDGLSEKMLQKTAQLMKERELGPRFAAPNSFEHVYGQKWKELYERERQRRIELDMEFRDGRRQLEADMELAYEDYKTQLLREDLQRRQQELERLEAAKRARIQHMLPPPGRQQFGGEMGYIGKMDYGNAPPPPPFGAAGGGMHDSPHLTDGPLGRNPPTFGGGQHGGAGLFGNGGLFQTLNNANGGGPPQSNNTSQQQQQRGGGVKVDDVQKILQTFKDSPRPPPQMGQQMFNLPPGFERQPPGHHPPPGNLLNQVLGPNLASVLSGPGIGGPPPPGRAIPPPPRFGVHPQQSPNLAESDFPPEKRTRR